MLPTLPVDILYSPYVLRVTLWTFFCIGAGGGITSYPSLDDNHRVTTVSSLPRPASNGSVSDRYPFCGLRT